MTKQEKNLLALRTEAIRQFRIAFRKGGGPGPVLEDIRREIHALRLKLDWGK